jgi:uncharacterized secreted repeat protein (TIGR03808 family)
MRREWEPAALFRRIGRNRRSRDTGQQHPVPDRDNRAGTELDTISVMTAAPLSRRFLVAALGATAATPTQAFAAPDAMALQEAIETATRAGEPFRLPLVASLAGALTLPEGAHLIGQPGRSRLTLAGVGAMLTATGLRRLTLEGVTLIGPGDAGEALARFKAIADLRIRDCAFLAAAGSGLMLEGCGGHVSASSFEGLGSAGLFSLDSRGLTIEGNRIARCGDNGIQFFRSAKGDDGSIIRANRISDIRADSGGSGQYGNGVVIFRCGGVIVEGNVIRRCAYSAVRNNGGDNVTISNNNCAELGETALYSEFAFQGATFTGNVVDGALKGISIANFRDQDGRLATVSGNVVRNIKRVRHPVDGVMVGGVGIAVEGDVAITGNIIENAVEVGLALGWGPSLRDVTATGNIIRNAETGIMVSLAPGAEGALIANNLISGAKTAIRGMAWDKPVTGDLMKETPPPQIKLDGNLVR